MKSEAMSLAEWVAVQTSPLYAVLAGASDAAPLQHYYQLDGRHTPRGLYLGTPYHDWLPVMPYLVELDKESPLSNGLKRPMLAIGDLFWRQRNLLAPSMAIFRG